MLRAAFAVSFVVALCVSCAPPAVGPKPLTYAEASALYEAEAKDLDRQVARLAALEKIRDDSLAADVSVDATAADINRLAAIVAEQRARVMRAYADKQAAEKREGR